MGLARQPLKLYNTREGKPAGLMTVGDLCELLNVKRSYVYQLTHLGKIPHFKLGNQLRFNRAKIEEWLKDQEVAVKWR